MTSRLNTLLLVVLVLEAGYLGLQARDLASDIDALQPIFGESLGTEAQGPLPWRIPQMYDAKGVLLDEAAVPDPMEADYVPTRWFACDVQARTIADSRRAAALDAQLDRIIALLEEGAAAR